MRLVALMDTGSSNNWDAHGDMMTHVPLAKNVDRPIAALLRDLERRGLLYRVGEEVIDGGGRRFIYEPVR